MSMNRREFLLKSGACSGALAVGGMPGLSFASNPGMQDKKLIVIFGFGGPDALSFLPPYGDPNYAALRGHFALTAPERPRDLVWRNQQGRVERTWSNYAAMRLDGFFGLHPALALLKPHYDAGRMSFVHAASISRPDLNLLGHFTRQEMFMNGRDIAESGRVAEGWMGRLLTKFQNATVGGVAFNRGNQVPGILLGPEAAGIMDISSTGPVTSDIDLIRQLYRNNPALLQSFNEAWNARQAFSEVPIQGLDQGRLMSFNGFETQAMLAAETLAIDQQYAPSTAYLLMDGWDTHSSGAYIDWTTGQVVNAYDQPDTYMYGRMGQLAAGLNAIVNKLIERNIFDKTLIVFAGEMGRQVRVTASYGTDHGAGGFGMVLTGNPQLQSMLVQNNGPAGGPSRVLTQWPGLSDNALIGGMHLRPTINLMDLYRNLIAAHFGLNQDDALDVIGRIANGEKVPIGLLDSSMSSGGVFAT